MAYEFQKLSEVEALAEVPEGASVLAEVNGDIKRIPGNGLGGSDIKTAIIKDSDYDDAIAMMQQEGRAAANSRVALAPTYSCINMTFEEAYEILASGEPLNVIGMVVYEAPMIITGGYIGFMGVVFGVPCITIMASLMGDIMQLYWTADGISMDQPGGGSDK